MPAILKWLLETALGAAFTALIGGLRGKRQDKEAAESWAERQKAKDNALITEIQKKADQIDVAPISEDDADRIAIEHARRRGV